MASFIACLVSVLIALSTSALCGGFVAVNARKLYKVSPVQELFNPVASILALPVALLLLTVPLAIAETQLCL
jgi:hypothetical protein